MAATPKKPKSRAKSRAKAQTKARVKRSAKPRAKPSQLRDEMSAKSGPPRVGEGSQNLRQRAGWFSRRRDGAS